MSINVGYYVKEDLRVSLGYKKVTEHFNNFSHTVGNGGTFLDGVSHVIDAYILNVYKDFPIPNTRWSPYIGAGLGLANITKTGDTNRTLVESLDGSYYFQVMAGLTYSYKKVDLFGEVSYGGVGETVWNSTNPANYLTIENHTNLTGSLGMRVRF